MNNIKLNKNFLYYVDNSNRRIVKCNLLSKRRCVYYQTPQQIVNYCVFDDNRIFIISDYRNCGFIDWNDKILQIGSTVNDCHFLRALNLYVIIYTPYRVKIYSSNNVVKLLPLKRYRITVSFDGKHILIFHFDLNKSYYMDSQKFMDGVLKCPKDTISNLELQNIITNMSCVWDYIPYYDNGYPHFVFNSHQLITNIDATVKNIVTNKRLSLSPLWIIGGRLSKKQFDIGNFLTVQGRRTKIYDVNSLEHLQTIDQNFKFVAYHSGLRLLITEDLYTYRFNGCEFVRIKLGCNYLIDRCEAPNQIMDIVLFDDLLFDNFPSEIVCTELYEQILAQCY